MSPIAVSTTVRILRRRGLAAILAVLAGLLAMPALQPGVAKAESEPATTLESAASFPPDVVRQFDSLSQKADALGFGIGRSGDPRACKHYQGVARSEGPGTPFLFVTRSGNHTSAPGCGDEPDDPGELLIVQMASRGVDGERMRSNRIAKGLPTRNTPPPESDTTVNVIRFNGYNGWPAYHHPGGVQLVGNILAVPMEAPCPAARNDGKPLADCIGIWPLGQILFIDVSNPAAPQLRSTFSGIWLPNPQGRPLSEFSPGVVALTVVPGTAEQPGTRYLMAVTGKHNHVVRFLRSLPTQADGSTDLGSANLAWEHVFDYFEDQIETDIGRSGSRFRRGTTGW